jgi:hypothetical protein
MRMRLRVRKREKQTCADRQSHTHHQPVGTMAMSYFRRGPQLPIAVRSSLLCGGNNLLAPVLSGEVQEKNPTTQNCEPLVEELLE